MFTYYASFLARVSQSDSSSSSSSLRSLYLFILRVIILQIINKYSRSRYQNRIECSSIRFPPSPSFVLRPQLLFLFACPVCSGQNSRDYFLALLNIVTRKARESTTLCVCVGEGSGCSNLGFDVFGNNSNASKITGRHEQTSIDITISWELISVQRTTLVMAASTLNIYIFT